MFEYLLEGRFDDGDVKLVLSDLAIPMDGVHRDSSFAFNLQRSVSTSVSSCADSCTLDTVSTGSSDGSGAETGGWHVVYRRQSSYFEVNN